MKGTKGSMLVVAILALGFVGAGALAATAPAIAGSVSHAFAPSAAHPAGLVSAASHSAVTSRGVGHAPAHVVGTSGSAHATAAAPQVVAGTPFYMMHHCSMTTMKAHYAGMSPSGAGT